MNLITVICHEDIPNIVYQAHSLYKNWLGEKRWIIVVEDVNIRNTTQEFICNKIVPIMKNWEVCVVPAPEFKTNRGWHRQQLCKLHASSVLSTSQYCLILDAKDFLIKPTDESFFFINGSVKVNLEHEETNPQIVFPKEKVKNFCGIFGLDYNNTIHPRTYTPWVWDKNLVQKTIDSLSDKGYNIYNITEKLPVWEFYAYWYENYKNLDYIDVPLFCAELWNKNLDASTFVENENTIFYKFHRDCLPNYFNFISNKLKQKEIVKSSVISMYWVLYQSLTN